MVSCLLERITLKVDLRRRGARLWGSLLGVAMVVVCQPLWADFAVQVGVYQKISYATQEIESLRALGFRVEQQSLVSASGKARVRLVVGPYPTRADAAAVLRQLETLGREGFIRNYAAATEAQEHVPSRTAVDSIKSPAVRTDSDLDGAPVVVQLPDATVDASSTSVVDHDHAAMGKTQEATAPTPMPETSDASDMLLLDGLEDDSRARFSGFFQSEVAYTLPRPDHLSKFRNTLELAAQGRLTAGMAWKVSGRVAYDAVFDINDFYPTAVRDDQQFEKSVRETYLDISAGDWDYRLGRQQIIWGEMVGLFFADVVSAKDMREFVLPDFDLLRIPQWAVRSEYFKGDFHGEAVWIPYPSYDLIGVPGSEFYPYPEPPPGGYATRFAGEVKPAGSLNDSGYGLRLSYLVSGWDMSGFFYSSMDSSPTFFRNIVNTPTPTFVYTPRHDRINQYGMTFSKDFTSLVFRAEAVYTQDRWFEVTRISDIDGVVRQDLLDYILGIEYPLPRQSRLNLQFFQRRFPDHDPAMTPKSVESGASVYASTHISAAVEAQLLWIVGLNRGDWMARPKLDWTIGANWNWILGADFFDGQRDGLFGRYADKDRVYTEVRFTF